MPCGVTVAQQILDLLVMVRIHARQPTLFKGYGEGVFSRCEGFS